MPADLSVVIMLTFLALVFTLVWPLADLPLRVPIGFLMVLFLPGYALMAALFPQKAGLNIILRGLISVVLSTVVILIVGLCLNFSPWGLRLIPIMASFAVVTVALTVVAYIRRSQLPSEKRFSTPFSWDLRSIIFFRNPAVPGSLIVIAELLIFKGHVEAAIVVHAINLVLLSLSTSFVADRTYQALMLLPLFRLLNMAMPVFFELTLYSYVMIYAPMYFPIYLILKSKSFSYEEIGLKTKSFFLLMPLSIVLGIVVGWGEFQIIRPEMLTPDVGLGSILKLSVAMIFFVGVVEEFMFRSVLQTVLEDRMGQVKGLLIASLTFGLMHSGYSIFAELVFVSFAGILFGLFFQKTKSLPLVALFHGVTNVSLFMIVPWLIGS